MSLHAAATEGDVVTLSRLLCQGAEVDEKADGWNALQRSAFEDRTDAVRLLLQEGASVNEKTPEGWTALHHAAYHGNADIVGLLLERGASVDGKTAGDGWTALHYAASKGYSGLVKRLLHNGADIGLRNADGKTALELASENEKSEVVAVLLDPSPWRRGVATQQRVGGGGGSAIDGDSNRMSESEVGIHATYVCRC